MTARKLGASRKYPFIPTVTGDVASHTPALQALIEAVAIHERRTADLDNSFVRVAELVDMGLITIKDGVFNIVDIDLGDIADIDIDPGEANTGDTIIWNSTTHSWGTGDHGNLGGLGGDDHPQYAAHEQDELITGAWTIANTLFFDSDGAGVSSLAGIRFDRASGATGVVTRTDYVEDTDEFFRLQHELETLRWLHSDSVEGLDNILDLSRDLVRVYQPLQTTTIELGDDDDTTLSRSGAGQLAVEGVNVVLASRQIISGAGLTGGGDLSADRTLVVGAGTGITVNADDVALDTSHVRNVDHTAVVLSAGAGLTGGGDIAASRSFAVGAGTGITVNADDVALSAATLASLLLADSAVQPGDLATVATSGDHGDLTGLADDDHTQYVLRSILTTDGDLFYRSSGSIARLPIGSNGEVLKVVTGAPAWAAESGGGGGGTVDTVVGTTDQIEVDDTDPANPVLSLAADVLTSLGLADTAVQPARQIISGAGLTGGGDLSADRTLAVGAGTGITVNADDVALSAATITSLGLADTAVQPGDLGDVAFSNDYNDLDNLPTLVTDHGALAGLGDDDHTQYVLRSILTTNGDLFTRTAGAIARLGVGSDGDVLTVVSGAPAWQAGGGGAVGANPSASVGLSAVNGSALTFLRSDGAPALDQGIAPTWTGQHIFTVVETLIDQRLNAFPTGTTGSQLFSTGGTFPSVPAGFSASAGHLIISGRSNSSAAFGVMIAAGQEGVSQAITFGVRPGIVHVVGDNTELRIGGAADDFALYHDGSNNNIDSNTGSLVVHDSSGNTCLTFASASVTAPATASTPTVRVGGAFTGMGSGGSTSLDFYINSGSAATRVLMLAAARTRMTGTSDATQPASMYSHYTTDMSTERGYWGFPTSADDTMIMRNIVGNLLNLRVSDNQTRLQINTTQGVLLNPVSYTGSASPEAGFRVLPQNIQNTNYTCVLGDSGVHVYKASGGAGETITIPANSSVAYPIGTMLTFVNQGGGVLTIAITTDTMQLSPGGATGSRTLADDGVATALKVASTLWIIWGTGLT